MIVWREENPGSNLEVIQYSKVTQKKRLKRPVNETGGKKFKRDELDNYVCSL